MATATWIMNQRVATRTWHFLLFRPSGSSLLCPSPLAPQLFAGPPLSPLPSGDSFSQKREGEGERERERERERPRWTSIYVTELFSEELVLGTRLPARCSGFGQKAHSTLRYSQAVPDPSTNRALNRLTSEVKRDPVHSTRYGLAVSDK